MRKKFLGKRTWVWVCNRMTYLFCILVHPSRSMALELAIVANSQNSSMASEFGTELTGVREL